MHKTKLMFLHCLTGTHPGSGTALGFVDLPVQRERHTQWPVIPGSSLKGVLRATCTTTVGSRTDPNLLAAFGPEPGDETGGGSDSGNEQNSSESYAGAISITDARILAFPVRSMRGVFAWATCPAALKLLRRNFGKIDQNPMPEIPKVEANKIQCSEGSDLIVSISNEKKVLLEEYDFELESEGSQNVAAIAEWIADRAIKDQDSADRFKSHMVILHDDDFTHFTRFATEVTARIRLDHELKSVEEGALFYEETLPPETMFQALTIASNSRTKKSSKNASEFLDWLEDNVDSTIQIGAGETVGKGICAVRFSAVD